MSIQLVNKNDIFLQFIPEKTADICKTAVGQCWYALQFVDIFDNEYFGTCKIAVEKCGYALKYVNKSALSLSEYTELCKIAINQEGCPIQFVKNQTFDLCLLSIQTNTDSIKFINNIPFLVMIYISNYC